MKYTYYLRKFWLLYLLAAVICLGATIAAEKTVTTIAEQAPIQRRYVLIIDPGHGGEDGGATSCSGVLESNINLQIALRLNDLCHLLGYETKMIRTTDISIYTEGETIAQKKISDLKERVRICNETDGAILLSIHQNTFPDSRYSGAQVFYAGSDGSEPLSKAMQAALGKRSAKKAEGIYLMEHIACPGVLIECGFLSNPEEEAKLRSPEYQKQLACIIAATAAEFVSTNPDT
jgi:N-acetylmuramoyl-L-alanine amidase